jgi:hypothetical protein
MLGSLELLGSQPDTRKFSNCPSEGIPDPMFSIVNCSGLAALTVVGTRKMQRSTMSTPSGEDPTSRVGRFIFSLHF